MTRPENIARRNLLALLGVGGISYASALLGCGKAPLSAPALTPGAAPPAASDFMFMQVSDTHWGFSGPPNPEAATTLERAVATINASPVKPDFIVFTGDLTHTTDDAAERRRRMHEFKRIVQALEVKTLHFLPGEHDASLDGGEAFREIFGQSQYAFEHGGLHFLALDNVSDPAGQLGAAQLEWLEAEVERVPTSAPLVVFAHRPLFDLYPSWDWMTRDGAKALDLLARHPNVTVFYGHIHQEHHHRTGAIAHHAARSLIFPLPAPGSVEKKAPLAWDPQSADHGLGYRAVSRSGEALRIAEQALGKEAG